MADNGMYVCGKQGLCVADNGMYVCGKQGLRVADNVCGKQGLCVADNGMYVCGKQGLSEGVAWFYGCRTQEQLLSLVNMKHYMRGGRDVFHHIIMHSCLLTMTHRLQLWM